MKNALVIALAVVALVACLFVARWAQQRTQVPTQPTTTSAADAQKPPATAGTPSDIENGLGWG